MKSILHISLAVAVLFVASYYLYRGYRVFEHEMTDFDPIPGEISLDTLLPGVQVVHWKLRNGDRQQAFLVAPQSNCIAVYVHGAPGSASGYYPVLAAMASRGFGALAIDMPGYGGSIGRRDWGPEYVESILAGLDYLSAHVSHTACVVGFGYSMGTYPLAFAAVRDKRLRGLVLLAGYTNYTDQLQHQFRSRLPGMGYFAVLAAYWRGVAVNEMNTLELVGELTETPVLVIHGSEDYVIPQAMAVTLANAPRLGELWVIDGATHVDHVAIAGKKFYWCVEQFFRKSQLTRPRTTTE